MPNATLRAAALILSLTAALPALAQDKIQKPSQGEMKAAVSAFFDAVNAGDVAKAQSLFAAGATVEDPVGAARRPADQFIPALIAGKAHYAVAMITGSNINLVSTAITLSRPNGTGVNAIEIFAFDPDGKISAMTVNAGREDRKL